VRLENTHPSDDEEFEVATVKAQIPGIFYRRSSPEAAPFVEEGSSVEAGQTIALIEVMKTFNDVKLDQAGTVTKFLIDDGDEVSIGQDIAEVETA
jgi:acetyl-CoA carboxylase biotin carboxyl carrier protein